jgi:hypothetical protein
VATGFMEIALLKQQGYFFNPQISSLTDALTILLNMLP